MNSQPSKIIFVAPALLILTHIIIFYAIMSFGTRVDGYVMNEIGRYLYATFIIISIGLILHTVIIKSSSQTSQLFALTFPALTSLSLGILHYYQPGKFVVFYQMDDNDKFMSVLVLILVSVVSLVYRDLKFAFISFLILITLQVLAVVSSNTDTAIFITCCSALIIIFGIRKLSLVQKTPSSFSLWFAAIVTNLIGAGVTFLVLILFPKNGWSWTTNAAQTVPQNAWDWSYDFALDFVFIAMFAPIIIGIAIRAYEAVPKDLIGDVQ